MEGWFSISFDLREQGTRIRKAKSKVAVLLM